MNGNPNLGVPLSAVDIIVSPSVADIAVRTNPEDIFSLWRASNSNKGRITSD